jgi:hypothetical protein
MQAEQCTKIKVCDTRLNGRAGKTDELCFMAAQ